ncbi:hypothetical protein NCAS_0I01480 [Naumovozyma castellii]|uniref:Uncharacterized protein n=1 Tax=Naumovozyma castellii TaxID=27288 RepID=G0VJY3_NAUCA|nr:hypothetical protein NCAS_0I01480 [Naumovozyma castellii CBS 4309]CCC71816.1 hypothetical protein NCAS_0I01480 [Naumovozyma castellii CBS 4309]
MDLGSYIASTKNTFAKEVDFWIDTTSTNLEEQNNRPLTSASSFARVFSDTTNVSNGQQSLTRKSPNKKPQEQTSHQDYSTFLKFDETQITCKDDFKTKKSGMVFLPRSFQHHVIKKWMKEKYDHDGYILKKNYNCPPSACVKNQEIYGNDNNNILPLNWISHRYIRNSNLSKELLCRFCKGYNWIDVGKYFRHLFLAHGILTEIKPKGRKKYVVEDLQFSDFFTVGVQKIEMKKFSSNLLPLLNVSLIPVPEGYYSQTLNTGFRRSHVCCPNCKNWFRLGWCEHDVIVREDQQNFDSIRDYNLNYDHISYTQKRDRDSIEGLYDNYFTHYVRCTYTKFDGRCLYVQVSSISNN